MWRFFFRFSVLLSCTLLLSCSVKRLAIRETAGIVEQGLPAFFRESDLVIAQAGLAANGKLLEALLESDPENASLLLLLSQAYCAYAFAFPETEFESLRHTDFERAMVAKERARNLYWRAKMFAERALSVRQPDLLADMNHADQFAARLERVGQKDLPFLFWYAFSWGGFINLSKDSISAVGDAVKVETMMKRVVAIDEGYFMGFGHLFLGIYYGGRPRMLGGNPTFANQHFDRMDELTHGHILIGKVLRAQVLAVQEQDEARFDALLKEVLATKPDIDPDQQLLNRVALLRAQNLQQNAKHLF